MNFKLRLFMYSSPQRLFCFMFLVSVIGVIIFNTLERILKFSGKKDRSDRLTLHWLKWNRNRYNFAVPIRYGLTTLIKIGHKNRDFKGLCVAHLSGYFVRPLVPDGREQVGKAAPVRVEVDEDKLVVGQHGVDVGGVQLHRSAVRQAHQGGQQQQQQHDQAREGLMLLCWHFIIFCLFISIYSPKTRANHRGSERPGGKVVWNVER